VKPRSIALLAPILALSLFAAACGDNGGDTTSTSATIKIGSLPPLTGDLSDFGPSMAEAVKLGAKVFQRAARKAGLNVEVTVSSTDSQTKATAAVEGARKLVDTDQVKVIIGPMASSEVLPVSTSVTIPKNILLITPSATSGKITGLKDNGLTNRTPPSDEYQAPLIADLVAASLPAGSTVALGARNDPYGVFIINGDAPSKLNGVKQELEKRGLKTRAPVFWNPAGTTFESEAQALVKDSPAGWVLIDFPSTWQKISAALVRTGKWDPAKTFSADGLKTSKLPKDPPTGSGKKATEGMRGTAPGAVGNAAFSKLWDKQVGTDIIPETYAPQAFDGTLMALLAAVQAAVKKAGSDDKEKIVQALNGVTSLEMSGELQAVSREGTSYDFTKLGEAVKAILAGTDVDYVGVSGPVDLDKDGNVESVGANYDVYVFKDGKLDVTSVVKAKAL
jgi:branched-chain amino acid transport system substrate-binding protein